MGLGRTGLDNFTPRGSGTANRVIRISSSRQQKKTTTLQIRINEDVLVLFKELCKLNDTDVSTALRAYIDEVIECGAL